MTAIKIELVDELIKITTVDPNRLELHGFGSFLCNVKGKDIRISSEAKEALLNQPERSGLQGMEFWPDNRIAWACQDEVFNVPLNAINMPEKAKIWVRKLKPVSPSIMEET